MTAIQKRLQTLEQAFPPPPPPPEDPRTMRLRLTLETLPLETLDTLIAIARAHGTGRELTESEWAALQLYDVALATRPMPMSEDGRERFVR